MCLILLHSEWPKLHRVLAVFECNRVNGLYRGDILYTRQHTFVSPSAFSRRAVVSYWRKYVHEVLVNHLEGLNLPRKSVVRLTDRPDMTLDVYRGRKTTIQQQQYIPGNRVNGLY